LKTGSGLTSPGKKVTWAAMEPAAQRSVASNLMRAVENATRRMMGALTEPDVVVIEDENIGKNMCDNCLKF